MRYMFIALMLLIGAASAHDHDDDKVNIGFQVGAYPKFVRVPGYPVYYAPQSSSNYFFYDGLYWVYQHDNWYQSSWYNGPWDAVGPRYVPAYVLRVPVRYYRRPPQYFVGWQRDDPPHWGEHWGPKWQKERTGWNQWNHHQAPPPAPLPTYQRQYSGTRYPVAPDQQRVIRSKEYRYQPHDELTQQYWRIAPGASRQGNSDEPGNPVEMSILRVPINRIINVTPTQRIRTATD